MLVTLAASAWESDDQVGSASSAIPVPSTAVEDSEFAKLEITFAHVEALRDLPPHHTDPFDRLLIAQAQREGLTLVTRDRQFEPNPILSSVSRFQALTLTLSAQHCPGSSRS